MAKDTKNEPRAEAEAPVGHGGLEMAIRQRARMLIDAIVEEELEQALGAAPSVRVGATRAGYRHGTRDRTLTTSLGVIRKNVVQRPTCVPTLHAAKGSRRYS
jgi:transposase-like protein